LDDRQVRGIWITSSGKVPVFSWKKPVLLYFEILKKSQTTYDITIGYFPKKYAISGKMEWY